MSHDPKAVPWRELIRLMIEDIDRIQSFIGDMSKDDFVRDERTVFAVCYAFVRIGQAVLQLPESFRDRYPNVPWKEARHFRNFMVHVYMAVDPARLHDTAVSDLGRMRAALSGILASNGTP
jgi:uncharacterized protein with HEPN domain